MTIGIDKSELLAVLPVSPGGRDGLEAQPSRGPSGSAFEDLLNRQWLEPPGQERPISKERTEARGEFQGTADGAQVASSNKQQVGDAHLKGISEPSQGGETPVQDQGFAGSQQDELDASVTDGLLVGKESSERKITKHANTLKSAAAQKNLGKNSATEEIAGRELEVKQVENVIDCRPEGVPSLVTQSNETPWLNAEGKEERIRNEELLVGSPIGDETEAKIRRIGFKLAGKNGLSEVPASNTLEQKTQFTTDGLRPQQVSSGDSHTGVRQHGAATGAHFRKSVLTKDGPGEKAPDAGRLRSAEANSSPELAASEHPAPSVFSEKKRPLAGIEHIAWQVERATTPDPSRTSPAELMPAATGTPTAKEIGKLNRNVSQELGSYDLMDSHIRSQLVQRVFHALRLARQRDGELRLRLHPPELGVLKIELKVDRGTVTARLETESEAAKDLLLEHLPDLRQRLTEHRLRIDRLDVGLMMQSDSGGRGTAGFPAHSAQPRQGPAQATSSENESAPQEPLPKPVTRAGGGFDVIV